MVIDMVENKNVPKIRFKGFTDDWEQCKLDKILIQRIEHQRISDSAPLLAFSYAEGVIDPEDKKTNKRDFLMTDKFNKMFSRTEVDDIIYNPANVIHGAIHRNKLKTGVVSPIYKIFKCQNVSSKYMGECLRTDAFINEIIKYIEGTVIKLRTLSPEKFLDMSIEKPKVIEEQEKIGELFINLNNLINLHQNKYDTLLKVKKSMLEKMFPKNKNLHPEIRFKEFTEVWEQCKLKELANIYDGTHQTPNYKDSGIKFLSVENIKTLDSDKYISYEDFKNNFKIYPEKNDILMTRIGDIGTTNIVKDNSLKAYYVSLALLKCKNINPNYLNIAIRSQFVVCGLKQRALLTAIPMKINKDQIGEVDILYPLESSEQIKIGQLFNNLDNLIALHQSKCRKLVEIKKYMLEKMFI